MVGKNNAALIAQIGAMTTPKVTEGKSIDIAGAIESYRRGKEWADQRKEKELQDTRRQGLVDAINSGDQTAINSALADYNPVAYAQMLKSDAQRAEDRKWALDDMATKHRYNLELAKAKDKEATAFQRNFDFIKQTTGLPDDAIVKIMYGGQNPTLDMAMLNPKGQDAHDKKIGEHLAEEQIKQDKMRQNDERLNSVITHIENNPSTVGMYAPLKTAVARALGNLGDKEWLNKRGYSSRALGEIQNNLIAEAKMSGQSGINTAREIEQATKGLNENSSQAEILGALSAMQDSISRLRKQQKTPSLKSVNSNGTDPFGIR